MSEKRVITEKRPPVGWITLNRPEKLNALDLAMWSEIPDGVAELESDPEIRVIVIRGAGEKAFAAGADISEFDEVRLGAEKAGRYGEANERAYRSLRECTKPTIAMIHGFCIGGGCALALNVDLRVASDEAKFAITPARLGLGYSFAGIEYAVRELGAPATRYLFLTAARIGAEKALEWGLVQEVHPAAELEAMTEKLALSIAENAPITMRAIKKSVSQAVLPPEKRRPEEIEELIRACFESRDYREGLAAFAEKRKPRFEGR